MKKDDKEKILMASLSVLIQYDNKSYITFGQFLKEWELFIQNNKDYFDDLDTNINKIDFFRIFDKYISYIKAVDGAYLFKLNKKGRKYYFSKILSSSHKG